MIGGTSNWSTKVFPPGTPYTGDYQPTPAPTPAPTPVPTPNPVYPPAQPPPAPAPVPGLDSVMQAVMDRTNLYRVRHQALPVQWDASIAAQAAGYVSSCPNGHSRMRGFGENLAW